MSKERKQARAEELHGRAKRLELELSDADDGEKLIETLVELKELATELYEEFDVTEWKEVPEQCEGKLDRLREMKQRARDEREGLNSGISDDPDHQTPESGHDASVGVDSENVDDDSPSSNDDSNTENSDESKDDTSYKNNIEKAKDHKNSDLYEVIDSDVTYDDIIGLDKAKTEISTKLNVMQGDDDAIGRLDLEPPSGVLCEGPPGGGKTLTCQALANEIGAVVLKVKCSDISSTYVGKPQQNVAKLFDAAEDVSPCILVFDEIDTLLGERNQTNNTKGHDKVVGEFLANMTEQPDDVYVVGTTNISEKLDFAVTRPGRLDQTVTFGLPGREDRLKMLQKALETPATDLKSEYIGQIAKETKGYSFADIEHIANEAAWIAFREGEETITAEHLVAAYQKIEPSADQNRWEMPEN